MRRLLRLSVILAAMVFGPWATTTCSALVAHKSVLILLPGQPGLPAASALATGIRSALRFGAPASVTIETEHVDVARFTSLPDQSFHRLGRAAVRALAPRVDLIDLTGAALEDVEARISALPERTIILVSSFQGDGTGRRFYRTEIVGALSSAANRPLFSVFGSVLGLGIVGGSLFDFEAAGREVGEFALGTLWGEPMPASPSLSIRANALGFDWRQLQRWGLDGRRLPPGSRVMYRQPTLWEQYRWHAVGIVLLVALQAGVILGLLIERRRRRLAQAGLAERLRFEALVESVSAAFASLPASRVDEQIRECLRRIVIFLGVDRGTLWQPSADGKTLAATHWIAEGVEGPPPTLSLSAFPSLQTITEQPEVLSLVSPDELPAEAAGERAALNRLGVKSLLAVPLRIGDRTLGILAFASLRAHRAWPSDVTHGLRTLSEIIASALARSQDATALESSEALSSAVITGLPGEAAILDADGAIVQANDAWIALSRGRSADSMAAAVPGANYVRILRAAAPSDEGARRVLALVESVLDRHRDEGVVEYLSPAHADSRWYEMRVQRLDRSAGGAAIMQFDVTARKRAEADAQRHLAEMAHLDRVAAMGQLGASLAHELNQPLTSILSNAQAAQRVLAGTGPDLDLVRECLGDIIRNDRRASEVIRRMRRLLKKGEVDFQPINVNELAGHAAALVASDALLNEVSVELALPPGLPIGYGDPVQIQQVILNLLVNAIAAAQDSPTGDRQITVSTAARHGHVEVAVRDSGKGIAEGDLDRVFEPFFSTKGEGLGVGLAISRSIVEAHGGRIWAENDAAGGATFRVQLPIERRPAA